MRIRRTFGVAAACLAGWLLVASGLAAQEQAAEVEQGDVQVTVKLADKDLETAVFKTLRHDPFTFPYIIAISATDQKVTLRGKIDTEAAKARVEQIVAGVPGVKDIENRLTINPNLFDKNDVQIKRAVETELEWSPLVRNRQIIVQVADGVATLHGEVKDRRARQSATANAVQGGAKKVVNKLTIKPSPNIILPSPWVSLRTKPAERTY